MARVATVLAELGAFWAGSFGLATLGFIARGISTSTISGSIPLHPCAAPVSFAETGLTYRELAILIFTIEFLMLSSALVRHFLSHSSSSPDDGTDATAVQDGDFLISGPSTAASIGRVLLFIYLLLNMIGMFCTLQAYTYTIQLQHRKRLQCISGHWIYYTFLVVAHLINAAITIAMVGVNLNRCGYFRMWHTADATSTTPAAGAVVVAYSLEEVGGNLVLHHGDAAVTAPEAVVVAAA